MPIHLRTSTCVPWHCGSVESKPLLEVALRQQAGDLPVLGKASALVLREHAPPVCEDVELTAPAGRDLRVDSDGLPELGRETRGPFVVPASGRAEEDLDGHVKTLVVEFQHDGPRLDERLEYGAAADPARPGARSGASAERKGASPVRGPANRRRRRRFAVAG